MKKTLTVVLLTTLLFSVLIGTQFINNAKAETLGPIVLRTDVSTGHIVKIFYPQNKTYNMSSILVDFTVEMRGTCFDFGYSLDGGEVVRVENITKISESGWIPYVTYTFSGSVFLANLSEGSHSITVYQGSQYRGINERYNVYAYDYTNFTIDTLSSTPTPYEELQAEQVMSTGAIFAVTSIIIFLSLLFYFIKRK